MMDRRTFLVGSIILGTASGALNAPRRVHAQISPTVYRIAHLSAPPARGRRSNFEFFLDGLRELGYDFGRSVLVDDVRGDPGKPEQFPALASRIVAQGVDVIAVQATRLTNDFRIVPTQANRAATAPAVEHAMKQATRHANAAVAAGGFAKDSAARADGTDTDADDRDNDRKGSGRGKDTARGKDAGNVGHPAKESKKGAGKGSDAADSSGVASAVPRPSMDNVAAVSSRKKPKK